MGRVPWGIENDNSVGSRQVDSKTSGSCRNQEQSCPVTQVCNQSQVYWSFLCIQTSLQDNHNCNKLYLFSVGSIPVSDSTNSWCGELRINKIRYQLNTRFVVFILNNNTLIEKLINKMNQIHLWYLIVAGCWFKIITNTKSSNPTS